MKLTDSVSYHCDVNFNVYENDILVNQVSKSNLLLDSGKLLILECLCNANSVYGNLTRMIFGDATSSPATTDIITTFGNYHTNNTTGYILDFVNKDNVKIYWQITESEFNGNSIKTIGLVGGNNTYNYVMNRVNLDSGDYVTKTPYIKITGYWTITLS